MSNNIIIRNANINDIQHILNIINYYINNSTNDYRYYEIHINELINWHNNSITNNQPIIVATINNFVVGYATYNQFRNRIGFKYSVEHYIYCHHHYTNKGIGKLLMNQLFISAKNNNIHTMIACIDSNNEKSIHFHHQLGFTHIGLLKEIGFKFNQFLNMNLMQIIL